MPNYTGNRQPPITKKCLTCGKEFRLFYCQRNDRKYCSRACASVATGKRYSAARTVITCLQCGKQFEIAPHRKAAAKFCGRQCQNTWLSRAYAQAKGDAMRGTGKKTKYLKEANRHQHRIVAEKKIGRKLEKGEVVHHVDENSWNNDPDNLVVITQSIHARIHFTKNRKCEVPGCDRKHAARGMCELHWRRWKKAMQRSKDDPENLIT